MNARRKGRRNEIKALEKLQADGYDVIITKHSKRINSDNPALRETDFFGLWDLIAITNDEIRLIQVKTNKKPYGKQRKKYELFRCPLVCSKEIWVYHDRVKEPEIIYL